jgi:hypothetical protein
MSDLRGGAIVDPDNALQTLPCPLLFLAFL